MSKKKTQNYSIKISKLKSLIKIMVNIIQKLKISINSGKTEFKQY